MPLSNRSNNRTDNQPATVGASDAPPNNKPPFAYGLFHQLRPHKEGKREPIRIIKCILGCGKGGKGGSRGQACGPCCIALLWLLLALAATAAGFTVVMARACWPEGNFFSGRDKDDKYPLDHRCYQKPHGPLISGFSLDGMDQPYSSSEKLALNVNALIKALAESKTVSEELYYIRPSYRPRPPPTPPRPPAPPSPPSTPPPLPALPSPPSTPPLPPLPPLSPCVPVEATTFVSRGQVARWKVEDDQFNSDWRSITQSGSVELLCLPSGGSSTVMMRRTCDDDDYCPGFLPYHSRVEFSAVDGCSLSGFSAFLRNSQPEESRSFYVSNANCGRRLEQPELAPELATPTATAPKTATEPDPAADPGRVVDDPDTRGQPAPLVPSLEQVTRRRLVDASWVLLNTTSAWLGLSGSVPHLLLGQLVERSFARDDMPLISSAEAAAPTAAMYGAAAAARLQRRRRLQQTGSGPGDSDPYNSYGCEREEQQTRPLNDDSNDWDPNVAYEAVGGDGNVFSEQGVKELCAVHEAFHLGPKSHLFCRRDSSSSSSDSSSDSSSSSSDLTALCVIKFSPLHFFFGPASYDIEAISLDTLKLADFDPIATAINTGADTSSFAPAHVIAVESVLDKLAAYKGSDGHWEHAEVFEPQNKVFACSDELRKNRTHVLHVVAQVLAHQSLAVHWTAINQYFDKDFSTSNLKSRFTRGDFVVGFPLAGYDSAREKCTPSGSDNAKKNPEFDKQKDAYDAWLDGVLSGIDFHTLQPTLFVFGFYNLLLQLVVPNLIKSFAPAVLVFLIVWLQTGAFIIAVATITEIFLSMTSAVFFAAIVFQITWFTFEHLLVVYIILAVGADDVFVFVDTYKQSFYAGPEVNQSLAHRMSHVFRRAGLSMLITSLTTCAAFIVSAASSPVPVLQNFGIFAACVILSDYMLVMTFLCTLVIVYHTCCERRCGCCLAGDRGETTTQIAARGGAGEVKKGMLTRVFEDYFPYAIIKRPAPRLACVASFFIFGMVCIGYASKLGPDTNAEQLLLPSHPIQRLINNENAFQSASTDETVEIQVVWGVDSVDLNGVNLLFDPLNTGQLRYHDSFAYDEEAHAHVLRACALLKASPLVKNKLLHSYSTLAEPLVGCFADSFEDWRPVANVPSRDAGVALDEDLLRWFKDRGIAQSRDLSPPPLPPLPPRPPSAPPGQTCCGEENSNRCANPPYECLTWREYYDRNDYSNRYGNSNSDDDSRYLHDYRTDVGFVQPITSDDSDSSDDPYRPRDNDLSDVQMVSAGGSVELRWFKVRASSMIAANGFLAAAELRELYDQWEALVARINEGAPAHLGVSFQVAGNLDPDRYSWPKPIGKGNRWVFMELQTLYQRLAITGMSLGLTVAFVVLLLATRNLIVAALATLTITMCIMTVLGTIQMMGWKLGFSECLSIMILCGFAVDYVVHLAHAYMTSTAKPRLERTHDALKTLGVSVFWGMLTSAVSGAVLASCTLQFLAKFGTFFLLTILWAYLWAVLFLMPLLATIGPEPLMPANRDGQSRQVEPSERGPDAAEQQDIEMMGTDGQGTMPPQYPDPLVVTGAPLAKNGSVVPATDGSSELAKDGSDAGVGAL